MKAVRWMAAAAVLAAVACSTRTPTAPPGGGARDNLAPPPGTGAGPQPPHTGTEGGYLGSGNAGDTTHSTPR